MKGKILAPLVLLSIASCGEEIGSLQSLAVNKQEVMEAKHYMANLEAVNPLPMSQGEARVMLGEGSLKVDITMNNVSASGHRQTLIRGECPTVALDANGDGYVDGEEYLAGDSELWDLDDSLEDTSEESSYPVGDASGQYVYSEALGQLAQDMALPDLATGTYSIVVYGTDDSTELPETVAGNRNLLPIACGTLEEESADDSDDQGEMDQDQDQSQDQGQQTQQQQHQQHQQVQQSWQGQQGQGEQRTYVAE